MAALNFVAIEDGLEEDPKLVTLKRILRVERSTALWYVVRLRRMILHHGNHITGALPKRFTDDDIAGFLDFNGRPRVLVAALKRQGFLARRSGRGYAYPDWDKTITGRYSGQREEDRLYHERVRKDRRSGDVGRQSGDTSDDGRATSSDIQTGRKEGRNAGLPPDPPLEGGASDSAARWEWLMQNAPAPQNREVCMRMLATMSAADWELTQHAYQCLEGRGPRVTKKHLRTLAWGTDRFIKTQAFLRFASHLRAFKNASNAPTKDKSNTSPEFSPEQVQASELKFLVELMADREAPESKVEKRKQAYFERWGEKPWETPLAGPAVKTKKTK